MLCLCGMIEEIGELVWIPWCDEMLVFVGEIRTEVAVYIYSIGSQSHDIEADCCISPHLN